MTQLKSKIKEDDEIVVIAGKDKGKRGKVLKVERFSDDRIKVLAEGVNLIKKHVKPNPQANKPGGIVEQEAFLDISNVKLYNPMTKKGDRVGYRRLENGNKVRQFKSNNELVDANEG